MDENGIIRRHYGRGEGGNAKGANILAELCTAENERGKRQTPADRQMASKTRAEADGETGGERRASGRSENEMMRGMAIRTTWKRMKFGCILVGSRLTPAENMMFVEKKRKALVFEINGSRPAAAGGQERGKAVSSGQAG